MRAWFGAVFLILLLLPAATAHVGSDVWPMRPTDTVVTPDDPVHAFPLLYPSWYQEAGDVLAVSVANYGPADLTMHLLADDEPLDSWDVPATGEVAIHTHTLHNLGSFALQFVNDNPQQSAAVGFFFDVDALCDGLDGPCVKRLPHDLGGGLMLAPVEVSTPGVYRTTVMHEELHEISYTVHAPDGTPLAVDVAAAGGAATLEWETTESGTHRIYLESVRVHRDVHDQEEDPVAAYDTQRIEVSTTGPFSRGIPAPTPLLVTVALALVGSRIAKREG